MAVKVADVHDAQFQSEVIDSEEPVLVDFWAEWCGPCKLVSPVVEELAQEFEGKMKFVKVDVDSNPQSSMQYGIRSIPTLLIFKDKKPVGQIVGAQPKATIKARINEALE